jgi:hypothetical protein
MASEDSDSTFACRSFLLIVRTGRIVTAHFGLVAPDTRVFQHLVEEFYEKPNLTKLLDDRSDVQVLQCRIESGECLCSHHGLLIGLGLLTQPFPHSQVRVLEAGDRLQSRDTTTRECPTRHLGLLFNEQTRSCRMKCLQSFETLDYP